MAVEMEQRVKNYWTQRSHDFGTVRKNELENEMGAKWLREIEAHLPVGQPRCIWGAASLC